MDKDKAKFILQSFRPDGADANDPSFAEALELAAADRELGEWLARERATDAAFAQALNTVEIPTDLKSTLLQVIEDYNLSTDDLGFDADFIGALASVSPPEGLRDQIINAMEVEQKVVRPSKGWGWRKLSSISAAAAAVVLGLFMTFGTGGNAIASTSVTQVHESAMAMLSAPLFSLDLREKKQAEIFAWLEGESLPSPSQLPPGLRDLEGVGCKFLEIGEHKASGSLICFRKNADTIVHLVMMEKKDFAQELPDLSKADQQCHPREEWALTQWADEKHAFFLLSQIAPEELAELF